MTTLTQALAACGTIGSDRFRAYLTFLLPAETEFEAGHYNDWDCVRTEDVPGDNGGMTRYGIDAHGNPGVDVAHLALPEACRIYLAHYWQRVNADSLPAGYGEVLCDILVNGGPGGRLAQQALNDLGAGLTVDGFLGPQSLAAMEQYGAKGVHAFIGRRDGWYDYLASVHPNDRQFLAGWHNRDEALAGWLDRNIALREHLGLPPATLSQVIA